jgi:hypothetical protein
MKPVGGRTEAAIVPLSDRFGSFDGDESPCAANVP